MEALSNIPDQLGVRLEQVGLQQVVDGLSEAKSSAEGPVLMLVIGATFLSSFLVVIPILSSFRWFLWVVLSVLLGACQLLYALYQLIRIMLDLVVMSFLKFWSRVLGLFGLSKESHSRVRRRRLSAAQNYEHFKRTAENVLRETNGDQDFKKDKSDLPQALLLEKTIKKLREARTQRKLLDLQFLLCGLLKRNHLGIHDEALYELPSGTKAVIEEFQTEIEQCLKLLLDTPELDFESKLAFFKKERRSLGQSALCLSGGGAITMYHIGVVKALIEAGLYQEIRVISGTSGGSIIAAMLAIKNEAELLRDVVTSGVSTDFKHDGSQARFGICWFPPMKDQLLNFLRDRVLVKSAEFRRCCNYYYGTTTFAEAFEHTKKHVSISVSTSQLGASYSGGGRRVLLNHISSPHITIASAVAASCSLPGIMHPNILEAKDADGNLVPFEADGVAFVDGSILADLPFKRMSTLFNVSNFIVSQVNFHVLPFLHKPHSPKKSSSLWGFYSYLEHDIRSRAQALSKLGLLPTFYGQNVGGVFKQKYHGDVTIVPNFTSSESFGLSAVINPTVEDIDHYIRGGEAATWPHINRIQFMMKTEILLRSCINNLQRSLMQRPSELRTDGWERQMLSLRSFNTLPAFEEEEDEPFSEEDESSEGKDPRARANSADLSTFTRMQWELTRLRDEVAFLENENRQLRSHLSDIAHLAVAAAPPPKQSMNAPCPRAVGTGRPKLQTKPANGGWSAE